MPYTTMTIMTSCCSPIIVVVIILHKVCTVLKLYKTIQQK